MRARQDVVNRFQEGKDKAPGAPKVAPAPLPQAAGAELSPMEKKLRDMPVKSITDKPGNHVNEVKSVVLKDGTKAIWKPEADELT